MSIVIIKNYAEHVRQETARIMRDRVMHNESIPLAARQQIINDWCLWEREQQFRELPASIDAPERVWGNCLDAMAPCIVPSRSAGAL